MVFCSLADSYSDLEARTHFLRLRDLLHLTPRFTADQSAPSIELSKAVNWDGLKADSNDSLKDVTQLASYFITPEEPIKCFKALNYSGFNPVPAVRRLQGDFFYLDFTPLETELQPIVICASSRGFYITQTKQGKFNPLPVVAPASNKKVDPAANPSCLSSTLSGCISLYSAKFKKSLEESLQAHQNMIAQESGPAVYPPIAWLSRPTPNKTHEFDLGRAESDLMKITETAVMASIQGRDWNEEMQFAREMPRGTVAERIERDRALYRIHAEYVDAAKEAAMAIFNGQIQAINTVDAPSSWIYIHNNIFFTQATDARGLYADCGGDETFEKTISNDLVALKRLIDVDNSLIKDQEDQEEDEETEKKAEDEEAQQSGSGIYTADNILIRYCGRSLLAQTIVPGLFNGIISGDSSVVDYGSLEGSGIAANPEIHAKLAKLAPGLHLKEHKVSVKPIGGAESDGSTATLWTSADVKGITGSDKRTYLLDLAHLFPRDGNYADDKYPTAVFRPELLSAYNSRTYYIASVRALAERRAQILQEKKDAEAKGETYSFPANLDVPQIDLPVFPLNADLHVRNVELLDSEESLNEDKENNVKLSRFLTDECIPMLINDWVSGSSSLPTDSYTLTTALHSRGINLRYLGRLTTSAASLSHNVRDVLLREMVVRAAFSGFRRLAASVPAYSTAEFIISFLNAFFDTLSTAGKGSRSGVKPPHLTDAQAAASFKEREDAFGLSHHSLWVTIRQIVESKYSYTLPEFIPGLIFELPTVRALCTRLGVQLEAKHYDFNKDAPFALADLVEVQPVLKHVIPGSKDGLSVLSAGRTLMEEGRDEQCIDVLSEALNVFHQTFGPLHRDAASAFSSLAIAHFRVGEVEKAIDCLERAVLVSEKTLGPDHQETINAYVNLSTVSAAALKFDIARAYARRALYLSTITAGPSHPETASAYINLAVLMQDSHLYSESLPVLTKAQLIIESSLVSASGKDTPAEYEMAINGASNSVLANISHLQAQAHAAQNHFRDALIAEKRNYELLVALKLEADDPRMVDVNKWLSELTRRAVEFEKTNGSGSSSKTGHTATSSIGGKKGVNTKVLKSALNKASSLQNGAAPKASASIKRTGATRTPGSVIGKATSAATPAKATGGKNKKAGTPVPDLL